MVVQPQTERERLRRRAFSGQMMDVVASPCENIYRSAAEPQCRSSSDSGGAVINIPSLQLAHTHTCVSFDIWLMQNRSTAAGHGKHGAATPLADLFLTVPPNRHQGWFLSSTFTKCKFTRVSLAARVDVSCEYAQGFCLL